jgi:hypothetical protein
MASQPVRHWHLSTGPARPDTKSFIIFARGQMLFIPTATRFHMRLKLRYGEQERLDASPKMRSASNMSLLLPVLYLVA